MPPVPAVPTVDVSADDRSARRRRIGVEHLVLTVVLLALYAVTVVIAVDRARPS